ncbi:UNVERIFIED_CONTAM: hypothetical protein GTU68_002393, partial [Idotea baltica]|nr:hypothetical protein [Idotea baltica]
ALGCNILVDDSTVFSLLSDSNVRKRFQKHITNSFVMCNRLLTWCPGVECTYAVRVPQNEVRRVICHCGEEFCFACGQPWHDPVLCRLLRRWLKKIQDDSETSNWIAANTKECPKCHVTIEKDGGCNHMICKSNSCRYEFCWVCLGRWEPHGSAWYNCNRYDEREAQKARDAQEISRAALQRYLFYFNRYVSHSQSLKFENKLYESLKWKMQKPRQGSWMRGNSEETLIVLVHVRQNTGCTLSVLLYLKKNNQSTIIENNQSDVEMATEQLSEYLEREITTDVLTDIKQKVQDKSRYCENRRLVLLKHVHEGYEHDMWEHLESS